MKFSPDSTISIVVTSCGRFDLLRRTLESLDKFNTAPIRAVFITEDSESDEVLNCIPEHWHPWSKTFVNRPKLGQLKSIDLAYAQVETPWVFHCEDDWEFYRPGFIEESMRLLEADPQALQVWLRSYAHDLKVHSPYVFLSERKQFDGIPYYQLGSSKADWQGFSLNPGLRRKADYLPLAPYAQFSGEKDLSRLYAEQGRYALILENDAVLHTGFGEHVELNSERSRKAKRKQREQWKLLLAALLGFVLGLLI